MSAEVAVIGAGPAGLSAAARLAGAHHRQVVVLDREQNAGGIPRHSDHVGYGMRDLHTFISGPAYARRLTQRAEQAGATIVTRAMVTEIRPDNSLDVTTPDGLQRITAGAVILATGARERPRSARMIPGDRPAGVYTTGHLQNIVHVHHGTVGERAVVVGAELVSWSAVMTLRHAGTRTVLMTTRYGSPESYRAFNVGGKALFRVPIATRTRLTRIIGRPRVEAVEIENLGTGERSVIACDTVVLTGDWIPDNELARSAGIELDAATKGPLVDTLLSTSRPGVFSAGNVLHPVDTADVAALDGTFVADEVARYLSDGPREALSVRLRPGAALRWLTPGRLSVGSSGPPRGRLLAWTDHMVRLPRVTISQQGRVVASRRLPWPATPGRVLRIPASILDRVNPLHGDATIEIANAGAASDDALHRPASLATAN
ncbi:FAD-binding protein [Mycolicibacterium moriokaense]|nr:FAD-binding protein [Mycolicibacterium moriokaense]